MSRLLFHFMIRFSSYVVMNSIITCHEFYHYFLNTSTPVLCHPGYMPVCVFFALNRSFYWSTPSTPSVHIKPFFLRTRRHPAHPLSRWFFIWEMQVLSSPDYDTGSYVVPGVDGIIISTMQCHCCAGLWQTQHTYASYPHTLKTKYLQSVRTVWSWTWIPKIHYIFERWYKILVRVRYT